jgi:hypothetical protein
MNVPREDIELIRSHLAIVRDEPISLIQEGALNSVAGDLINADSLSENIEAVKVHLGIVGKYPLSDRQKQALDLASEVVDKISLAAKRHFH